MKQIVYLITSNGIDGRDKESVHFASFNEQMRNDRFNTDPNKCYFSIVDRIIDIEIQNKHTLAKLDALDKLITGICESVKTF